MKEKKKRDSVVPEMRDRLMANRSGKMTPGQWLDIVMQPLTTLLLLLLPASMILFPRLLLRSIRGIGFVLLVVAAVVIVTFVVRAYRYARAPIHFSTLRARSPSPPFWMFWKPLVLQEEDGTEMRFGKRLAPRPIVHSDNAYIVYYLKEPEDNVLLSIAPADHPHAERWQPDRLYEARFNRRSKR